MVFCAVCLWHLYWILSFGHNLCGFRDYFVPESLAVGHSKEYFILVKIGSASCLDCVETGLQWSWVSVCSSADTLPCKFGSRHHRGTSTLFRAYSGSQPTAQYSWPRQISTEQLHFFLFQGFCFCFGDTWKRASPNGKDKSPRPASCGCTFSATRVTESLSSGMRFGQWHLRLMQLIQPYPR